MKRSHLRPTGRAAALLLLASGLTGCNKYLLFNQAGYEQASFSNEADILFVIDNSASMAEETEALGLEFNSFINRLTSAEVDPATETLTNAVDNYLSYTQNRGRFLDYNLGIVTTSVAFDGGTSGGVDPGEAGYLIGDPIAKGEGDVAAAFREQLFCDTAYWGDTNVPTDDYTQEDCDNGVQPDLISQEYLDCICGFAEWEDTPQGSGNEEPLEAALMALCRASDDPPEACFEPLSPFASTTSATNEGFLRDKGTTVIVMISDEGDNSRRMDTGVIDATEAYLAPFADFGKPVKLVGITPAIEDEELGGGIICGADLSPAPPTWSIERIIDATAATGGFHENIIVQSADGCAPSDFSKHLERLGDLLNNLLTSFQLQSIPDVTTIRVWVEGEEVDPADPNDAEEVAEGSDPYGPGWSYDPGNNAVVFWGSDDDLPGFNEDVEIFYRPLSGTPRSLPF